MRHEEWVPGYTTSDLSGKPSRCPSCADMMDKATYTEKDVVKEPYPGALAICFHCGELAIYDQRLRLRKLTERELTDLQRSKLWPRVERQMRWAKSHAPSPAQKGCTRSDL